MASMEALSLVLSEFVVLAIVCILLMRYYSGPMVEFDVKLTVYLSWVLGLSGILLLPYDIASTDLDASQNSILDTVWTSIYWSTFVLAWLILPVQMEYHNSGYFTFFSKMFDAIRRNFYMGLITMTAGVAYFIYMLSTSSLSTSEVIGFMMALSNTYGILLILFLMGTGLVALPRRLWQMTDDRLELQRLYIMANNVESAYQDARFALEDCEADVAKTVALAEKRLSNQAISRETVSYVEILRTKVSNFVFEGRSHSRQHLRKSSVNGIEPVEIISRSESELLETKSLVDLHSRLISSQIRMGSCDRRWSELVQQIFRIENRIKDPSANVWNSIDENWCEMKTEIYSPLPSNGSRSSNSYGSRTSQIYFPIQTTTSIWNFFSYRICQIINYLSRWKSLFYKFISVSTGSLSIIILWSEMALSTPLHSPIGSLIGAYSTNRDSSVNSAFIQFVCFFTLAYMSLCTYWSLFQLNLGWAYTLQGPQLSPPSSLIFNGQYFSRLQFPLGYNFLLTLNAGSLKKTSFSELIRNNQFIVLNGASFTVFVPIIMILFSLSTLLNVLPRILKLIGIESAANTEGVFFDCRKSTERSLSGDDLVKYETGRNLVNNQIKQTNLKKLTEDKDAKNSSPFRNNGKSHNISLTSSSSYDDTSRLRVDDEDDEDDGVNSLPLHHNISVNFNFPSYFTSKSGNQPLDSSGISFINNNGMAGNEYNRVKNPTFVSTALPPKQFHVEMMNRPASSSSGSGYKIDDEDEQFSGRYA